MPDFATLMGIGVGQRVGLCTTGKNDFIVVPCVAHYINLLSTMYNRISNNVVVNIASRNVSHIVNRRDLFVRVQFPLDDV